MTDTDDPVDMEALAAQEHESWSKWTVWMLSEMEKGVEVEAARIGSVGLLLSNLPCVERWRRQIATPYAELSEKEKESDRKVVREKLGLYRPTPPKVEDGLYQFSVEQKRYWLERPSGPPIISLIKDIRQDTSLNLKDAKALFDRSRHLLPPRPETS